MIPVLRVPHEEGRTAFLEALEQFLGAVEALDDHALLAASRCWGWAVVDVVVHVRAGLDEVAAALLSVGEAAHPPDRDAATYWLTTPPDSTTDEVASILATRRLGSVTRVPRSAVVPLRVVSTALRSAVGRLADDVLEFQGWVLTTGDFLATWAVELAVHQLDLGRDLDVRPPAGAALTLTRRTVEALLEAPLPGDDDVDAVLLGTGRRAPTEDERVGLGPVAARLPVL